ncbi:hypothetical protein TH47_20360 [Thalassospira sp. MCCC 1A02803]|nr:hypothetical protein TH47_20360 [Thalassospira sp. MCCC 1A02803]
MFSLGTGGDWDVLKTYTLLQMQVLWLALAAKDRRCRYPIVLPEMFSITKEEGL